MVPVAKKLGFQFTSSFVFRTGSNVLNSCTNSLRLVRGHKIPAKRRSFIASAVPRELDVGLEKPIRTEVIASPLRAGIKSIAIGKHGTRPIPEDIRDPIISELSLISKIDVAETEEDDLRFDFLLLRASFLGSLFVKASLDEGEMRILSLASNQRTRSSAGGRVRDGYGLACSAGELLAYVTSGECAKSMPLYQYALRLLDGELFTMDEAEELGSILYSDERVSAAYEAAKVLVVHVMRIRHETAIEIAGLARAAAGSLSSAFSDSTVDKGTAPFVLLAEPFDGTATWDILTPLLARHLKQKFGFNTVMSTGISSGPKMGPNLHSVAQALGMPFARDSNSLLVNCDNEFGAVVDQRDLSPGLARWTHLRRVILKRPSIATVEKYVDPAPGGAAVFVSSAFHGAYIEKMGVAAEALGFPAYVIVGRGMEGTTGVGVGPNRKATFLVGIRKPDCSYMREEILLSLSDIGVAPNGDLEAKDSATATSTAVRIQQYALRGNSGVALFDTRVKATLGCFDVVFSNIMKHMAFT